jgi:hypothetical protein
MRLHPSKIIAGIVAFTGVVVLLGWMFHIEVIKSILPLSHLYLAG